MVWLFDGPIRAFDEIATKILQHLHVSMKEFMNYNMIMSCMTGCCGYILWKINAVAHSK